MVFLLAIFRLLLRDLCANVFDSRDLFVVNFAVLEGIIRGVEALLGWGGAQREGREGAVFEVGGVWELPFGSSGVEKFHLGFELGSEAELDYEIIQLRL